MSVKTTLLGAPEVVVEGPVRGLDANLAATDVREPEMDTGEHAGVDCVRVHDRLRVVPPRARDIERAGRAGGGPRRRDPQVDVTADDAPQRTASSSVDRTVTADPIRIRR